MGVGGGVELDEALHFAAGEGQGSAGDEAAGEAAFVDGAEEIGGGRVALGFDLLGLLADGEAAEREVIDDFDETEQLAERRLCRRRAEA